MRKTAPKCSKVIKGVLGIENGNTESQSRDDKSSKTPNSKYKYDFVLNNYTKSNIDELKILLQDLCKKFIFGEEIGEQGTPHLQGYINLKVKRRITELKKLIPINGMSYRECRNEEALIEYCKKDGKIHSYGFPKPIKTITNLYKWQQYIVDIIRTEPDGRSIHWYYDTEGNKGKSALCKYLAVKHNCLIIQGGKLQDIMNIIFNADMDNTSSVIIDIPRCNKNKVSYSAIECILNGMITNTKFETGVKIFNAPHVIVFSNFEPETDKLSKDRWKITDLDMTDIMKSD